MTQLFFEIQHNTLCDGWANTWTDDTGKKTVFTSYAQAADELEQYFKDCNDAVKAGDMLDAPNLDDYRIEPLTLLTTSLQ